MRNNNRQSDIIRSPNSIFAILAGIRQNQLFGQRPFSSCRFHGREFNSLSKHRNCNIRSPNSPALTNSPRYRLHQKGNPHSVPLTRQQTFRGIVMQIRIFALLAMAVLAGCAKRPDAIVPVNLPVETYANIECQQLQRDLLTERQTLATLSASQNSAANADAVGVFLVGVPVASLTDGDKEGLIAVSKGKIQAMENASLNRKC